MIVDNFFAIKEKLVCLNNGNEESNSAVKPLFETIFKDKSNYEK